MGIAPRVFTRSGSTWTQQGPKLTPNPATGYFGASVALSADGNTAVIGANENGTGGGAWVFARSGSTWAQQGPELSGTDETGFYAEFGSSVALSADGNTALISDPQDGATVTDAGAVWVFTRSGTTWTPQGSKLTGSGETGHGYFGYSVALSSDGDTALIGGAFDDSQVGAVWAFTRSGTTWTPQGSKLTANDESGSGTFGTGVALSSDGSTALIGGPGDNSDVGAAWAFQASGGGGGEPSNSGAVPTITGSPRAGKTLTCSPGAWTGNPSFAYQYSDDGTPIQGATSATYKIQTIDEGLTLTCTVIASNASGSSKPVTSKGVLVPVPKVARCPAATGSLTATKLGQLALGMTRTQARHAYRKSSNRGRKYEDFFCLTPRGVRDGYGSPKEPKHYRDRVIWISTSSAYYAVHHIRVGATIPSAEMTVKLTGPYVVGKNTWYFTANGGSNAIFKVRDNVIEEIGIADKALTTGKKAQKRFLTSFT